MKITLPENVNLIINTLTQKGFEAYIVGGCVRDSILGLTPKDWDITTDALPKDILLCFKNYKTIETGIKHGTVAVVIDKEIYEITTYRIDGDYKDNRHPESVEFSDKLEYDLARRDFTVNAMAYSPKAGLVDLYGGMDDLKYKAIRCVGQADKRFKEDALRILRALRFASVYDFTIEVNTSNAIFENAKLLNNISSERITAEFNKLICGSSAAYILNRYKRVIEVFIPEIEVMFNFDQKTPHHNKTLWKHTLSSMSHIDNDLLLRLTMFFHDIGKPLAQKYDEEKNICHYKGHNVFSCAIAENVMKRLRYSNEMIHNTKELIYYHDVRCGDNKKHIKKVLSKIGEDKFRMLLKVQRADILAQSLYQRDKKLSSLALCEETFEEIIKAQECFSLKDLAVNGRDLIHLGVTKGEEIGKTLNTLLALVIDGKIENEKQILLDKSKELNNL